MNKIRTFVAIEIPDGIRSKLAELQSELKPLGGRVSWVKVDNIHLTLKFLGDTETTLIDQIASQLQRSVETIAPFRVDVAGVGAFPNEKHPRVIWVGASSQPDDQLKLLAARIDAETARFGFQKENRPFSGHLTLGRVKDLRGIEPIMERLNAHNDFHAGDFWAEKFVFMRSELHPSGSIYTPLKIITLGQR